MPTPGTERPGLGGATKLVADRVRTIVQLELQLAAAELKKKVAAIGVGIGLVAGAGLFAFFALAFLLAAIAAGIATALAWWLSLLIVGVALLLLAGILTAIGVSSIKKGSPPMPEQAIVEAKLTAEALKNGN
jgi:hypothetical protein